MYNFAVILAGGDSTRTKSKVKKQFELINDKEVLYYSLKAFSDNKFIDEIVIVCNKDDLSYIKNDIVDKYNFSKVTKIVYKGTNRYDSSYNALCEIEKNNDEVDYVFIHDASRPNISSDLITKLYSEVKKCNAVVPAYRVTNTICEVKDNTINKTLDRNILFNITTPQAFDYTSILNAYKVMYAKNNKKDMDKVTDDSYVYMNYNDASNNKVKIVEIDDTNIKITSPTDLILAKELLK